MNAAVVVPKLPSVKTLYRMTSDQRSALYTRRIQAERVLNGTATHPTHCQHGKTIYNLPTSPSDTYTRAPQTTQGRWPVPTPNVPEHPSFCHSCEDHRASLLNLVRSYGLSEGMWTLESIIKRRLTYIEAFSVIYAVTHYGQSLPDADDSPIPGRAGVRWSDEGFAEEIIRVWVKAYSGTSRGASLVEKQNSDAEDSVNRHMRLRRRNREERDNRLFNIRARLNASGTDEKRYSATKAPAEPDPSPLRRGQRRRMLECECETDDDGERIAEYCECGYEDQAHPDDDDDDRGYPGMRKASDHGVPFQATKADRNRRLVGVELEFNNATDISYWIKKWRGAVHSDGSCGWEAVTTPIAGGHINQCMIDLARCLRNGGAEADERCGVHVHVDAGDVRWADMYRLIRVYSIVEPVLYLIAGQHRMAQNYCLPCGKGLLAALDSTATMPETDRKLAITAQILSTRGERPIGIDEAKRRIIDRFGKKDGGRYKGMNLLPWLAGRKNGAHDTTIEFRMHRNSLDGPRVAGWAQLCAALVEYCVRATDAEVENLPKSALRVLCDHVSPDQRTWILKRVLAWRSVTTAERNNRSNEAGERATRRRLSFKKGMVVACAV